jgi:DHA1 family bicyclomycin/chloramphenicol resistance-like MFS transporter
VIAKDSTIAPVLPGYAADGGAVAGTCPAPARHGWRVLAILSALMGFASISTDLYLPAMPAMSRALHANPGTGEWTISGYLIGFSLGQLFWGPIGDRYGRRLPVAIGFMKCRSREASTETRSATISSDSCLLK